MTGSTRRLGLATLRNACDLYSIQRPSADAEFATTKGNYRTIRSRMVRARVMLSAMTDATREDGLPMSGSRANRTAAMIEAEMTSVEANRSSFVRSAFPWLWLGASRSSINPRF